MVHMRKQYEAAFKAKVALEAAKGEKTIAQLSSEFGVHPNQIFRWRQELLDRIAEIFSDRRPRAEQDREQVEAELYRQIGQLKVELDWLKKKSQKLLP
jgi:transposase